MNLSSGQWTLLFWILAAFQFSLMLEFMLRFRTISASLFLMLFILMSQVTFRYADALDVQKFMGPEALFSYQYHNEYGIAIYFSIFILVYLSTIGFSSKSNTSKSSLDNMLMERVTSAWVPIAAALYALVLLHLLAVNKQVLWKNTKYLLLSSPDGLNWNTPLTSVALSLFPFAGMLAAALMAFNFSIGSTKRGLLFLPIWVWTFVIAVANASRSAAILMLMPGIVAWATAQRGRSVALVSASILAGIVYLLALINRSRGVFGVSAVPEMLTALTEVRSNDWVFAIVNFFQGIFLTIDGLALGGEHASIYKILSFSPLPGFIDGFDLIRERLEIRLHLFVPMSAITEVILFGPFYTALAALILFACLRVSLRVSQRTGGILAAFTASWITIFFIQANAYPLRNVLRPMLLVIVILLLVEKLPMVWAYLIPRRKPWVDQRDSAGSDSSIAG